MRAAAQHLAEVGSQRPYISSFGAAQLTFQFRTVQPQPPQFVNRHLARRAFDFNPLARQLVQRLAIALDRRVHRRRLLDHTGEAPQRGLHLFLVQQPDRAGGENLALGVTGRSGYAQPAGKAVCLVGIQQQPRQLGSFAQTDGQQTAGQRIKAAGMASLLRLIQALDRLQRRVGGPADRLVQQQHAADRATVAAIRHSFSSGPASA